jgi:hypothetical protein
MRRTILLTLLVFAIATAADAATVRGKVTYSDARPHPGVSITLTSAATGATPTVRTDEEGMFYLQNVPAGQYTMEVTTSKGKSTYRVTVTADAYSDVPPVKAD